MKYEKLGEHVFQVRGISFKPENIITTKKDGYVPVIRSNNITEEGFKESDLIYINKEFIRSEQVIKGGDLVLTASSGSKKTIGKNIQFDSDFNGSFGAFCKLVRPKKSIDSKYLYHFFKTHFFRDSIERIVQGANIANLKNEYIDDLKILLPPLEDQIRIATLLSKVENLTCRRREQLKQLDQLLKSVFLGMFGDPVRNERGWDKPELKQFGQILTGNTPPRIDASNYDTKHIEWIKTDNIFSDSLHITQATEYLSESGVTKSRTVTNGALLVACIAGSVGSIGRAALTNRTVAFNQQINAIQSNKDINPLFLYVLFKISKTYVQSHATKGMKKILTKGDFEKITMIKPPIDLQNQFAVIVEMLEGIKSRYQQSLIELKNFYGVLSQKAFKGELDLSRVILQAGSPELMKKEIPEPIDNEEINTSKDIGFFITSYHSDGSSKTVHQEEKINLFQPSQENLTTLYSQGDRIRLLDKWFNVWIENLINSAFPTQKFMDTLKRKLSELLEDDLPEWVVEYEYLKSRVFEALQDGRLTQTYDDTNNRVKITAI
ncbi:MAG: restriction endonuclease subunit S [Chlorobium sp.]